DSALRDLAIVVLIAFGVALAVPAAAARIEAPLSRLARFGPKDTGDGFGSGLAVGAAMGFVYTPCAGPILAAVISVGATTGTTLRGRVVLSDFWTYPCIHCIRTLPYLAAWDARYRHAGLTIVGVHSPEFSFEKDAGNVQRAVKGFGIRYPVVQDNNLATWQTW